MTRNFEEEYKKYAVNSVPDLWGRIEAAIDEKESIKGNNEIKGQAETGKVISLSDKKIRHINPAYVTAIAAAACLFLAIGVVRFIGGANKSAESATAPAAAPAAMAESNDSAMAAADEAPAAYEAEAEAEEAIEEAPAVYDAQESAAEETDEEEYEKSESAPEEYTMDAMTNGAELPVMEEAAEEAADDSLSLGKQYAAEERKVGSSSAATHKKAMADDKVIELVCRIEDLSQLEKEGLFKIRVLDPLKTDIKKDEVITVKINEEDMDILSDILIDSRSNEIAIKIKAEEDGNYTFVSAEIKK